ncbi:MAG: hypothetical protein WD851_17830 [Pirellulales bacterium]
MRVISVTPAGRRRYMEVLVPHLLRQRHVLQEHHWWLNTDVAEDIAFVRQTCLDHPDFFRVNVKPFDSARTHGDNIWKFFKDFAEPETVYVRFDDDIVWMADDAVERLVRFRQEHRSPPLVLGNIVNNAVCSTAHQKAGLISAQQGVVRSDCLDENGWKNPLFSRLAHESFLNDLEQGRAEQWTQVEVPIGHAQRFSINVICWLGEMMASLAELANDDLDEEPFLTERLPLQLGQSNRICNEALFAHFAFWPQRPYMDWTSGDLLERYRALAMRQPARAELLGHYRYHDATWRASKPFRKLRRSVLKRLGKKIAA